MSRVTDSFLFLSANTPWVYALAESLARRAPVHAVRLYDWQTYWQQQPSWPAASSAATIRRTLKVLPPGYAGRAEPLLRPYLRLLLRRWQNQLAARSGGRPWVVAPYFYLAPWVTREVPADRLVYYNLDDYTRYRPSREALIRRQESQLVRRATRTVCLAQHRVQTLKSRHPRQADRIHHFPLGVKTRYLNPHPEQSPEPQTVGYVGNLSDRVDWSLVHAVATRLSEVRFLFAGSLGDSGTTPDRPDWTQRRADALALPNVQHLGRIPQDAVTDVYWSCAANWIPYDPNHPFNVASCPTKVMDMIASGRPVVSTPVPECTLYPDWIDVADTPAGVAEALRRALNGPRGSEPAEQVHFARQQTWEMRAHELQNLLHRPHDET
jgi:glycosyltransferase involved in cell wall biosynthesis